MYLVFAYHTKNGVHTLKTHSVRVKLYEVLKETGENRDIEQALSVKINKEKTVGELEELIRKCSSLEPHQLAREIVSRMYITNHV